jgi:glycosyltransferase involved in cell wall biosynthesis
MPERLPPVRILRVITRMNIGGPAIHAVLLTAGLNAPKFASVLVHGRLSPGEGDMSYYAARRRLTPLYVPQLQRELHPVRDLVALLRLLSIMWRVRPQIVHTHTAKAGFLGRLAAVIYRGTQRLMRGFGDQPVRIVHTFHGHVFDGYFSARRTRVYLALERWLARHTDRIVAVSQTVKAEICESYRIAPSSRVEVIPLGFEFPPDPPADAALRLRRSLSLPSDCPLVGIIGRLTPIKNHSMFLHAAERLVTDSTNDVRFVIVGDGELRAELEAEVRASRLHGRLVFAGWRRDMDVLFGGLDVVVLTSHNEGTPVALIEALALGKAVVATRVGGVPDIVEDAVTGYLVEADDDEAMAARIAVLLADARLRERLGREGRNRVRGLHAAPRLIQDVSELYDQLLQASPR